VDEFGDCHGGMVICSDKAERKRVGMESVAVSTSKCVGY
jgi:hypothetical protein